MSLRVRLSRTSSLKLVTSSSSARMSRRRLVATIAMGLCVLLAFIATFVLTSSASSVLLQQVLRNHTANCPHCDDQLRLTLKISRELVKQHISAHKTAEADELGQKLNNFCINNGSTNNILLATRASLGPLRKFAQKDSFVAILGRRIILACIALHRGALDKNDSPEEVESVLADATKELYGTHVDTVLRKALLDYLHISKSGGTSFSLAARLSQCKMAPGIGQPLYLGDLPHWINRTLFYQLTGNIHVTWSIYGHMERGEVAGCRARIANVTARGLQYLSNEYTLHGGLEGMGAVHVCRSTVNVVTLRSPEARLVSHLHFILAHIKARISRHQKRRKQQQQQRAKRQRQGQGLEGVGAAAEGAGAAAEKAAAAAEEERGRDLFLDTFCSSNVTMWRDLTPAILDNYNVRSFIGERAFHTHFGGIGSEHLDVARRLLLQFDLVLDLDAGEEAADLLMYQGLGWNVTLAEVHARSSDKVSTQLGYNRSQCANEGLLTEVLPRQGPDRELYSLGRALSLLDQLLLGWARQLGLQPRRPAAAAAGAAGGGADGAGAVAEGAPSQCGLIGQSHWRPNATVVQAAAGGSSPRA